MLALARAGIAALRRYPLLCLALYALQLLASALAGLAVTQALATAFTDQPAIERAADGHMLALAVAIRDQLPVLSAAFWTCLTFVLLYAVLSWFTTGGLLATLLVRPEDRRRTAETFGAGGAANLLGFARLWLWSLIPYAVAAVITVIGLAVGLADFEHTLTTGELWLRLTLSLLPAALVWWIVNTAVDFARIELVRRRRKSALRAILRGFADTFTSPLPLPHAGLYYLVAGGLTAAYTVGLAGVELSLFGYLLIRQTVAISRFAGKIWLMGGQVALAQSRRPEPLA